MHYNFRKIYFILLKNIDIHIPYHTTIMENLIIQGLTIAGKEVLTKLIYDTYTVIQENEQHPKAQVVLEQLDLEADLRVIEALVRQVEVTENNEGIFDAVDVALYNLKQMIELIQKELQEIHIEQELHKTRYLADYRDPSFHSNLDNLIKHKKLLDKRIDFLIKLLNLKKNNPLLPHSFDSNIKAVEKYKNFIK